MAIEEVFAKYSLTPPTRKSLDDSQWIDDFSPMYEYSNNKDMWFEITDLYCSRLDGIFVFKEALIALEKAAESGIVCSVATGRTITNAELERILADLNIKHYFKSWITYGESNHVKVVQAGDVDKTPMFERVCKEVDVPISESWYVTDIAKDADVALKAGFQKVFGVTTGGINPALFSKDTTVINSLDEML